MMPDMTKAHTNLTRVVMPEDEARSELEPYIQRIAKCLHTGPQTWEELVNLAPAKCKDASERSIASLEYDWIATAIEREFEHSAPDVYVLRKYTSIRLNIRNLLLAKVNKVNARGRIAINRTATQRAFYWQREEQTAFPGMEHPTRIIIGWKLDKLQREITDILVRCPFGPETMWEFYIAQHNTVDLTPFRTVSAATDTPRARVVPKVREHQDEQTS